MKQIRKAENKLSEGNDLIEESIKKSKIPVKRNENENILDFEKLKQDNKAKDREIEKIISEKKELEEQK